MLVPPSESPRLDRYFLVDTVHTPMLLACYLFDSCARVDSRRTLLKEGLVKLLKAKLVFSLVTLNALTCKDTKVETWPLNHELTVVLLPRSNAMHKRPFLFCKVSKCQD